MENGREPSLRVFNLEGVFDDVKVAWECGCSRKVWHWGLGGSMWVWPTARVWLGELSFSRSI